MIANDFLLSLFLLDLLLRCFLFFGPLLEDATGAAAAELEPGTLKSLVVGAAIVDNRDGWNGCLREGCLDRCRK